jgi:hypothetical protein
VGCLVECVALHSWGLNGLGYLQMGQIGRLYTAGSRSKLRCCCFFVVGPPFFFSPPVPRPDLAFVIGQNSVAKARDIVKGFKKHQLTAQFDQFDVFHTSLKGTGAPFWTCLYLNLYLTDLLPPSTFDCVSSFNETHLIMESEETAQSFFSNVVSFLIEGKECSQSFV